jgi:hypothetical protein
VSERPVLLRRNAVTSPPTCSLRAHGRLVATIDRLGGTNQGRATGDGHDVEKPVDPLDAACRAPVAFVEGDRGRSGRGRLPWRARTTAPAVPTAFRALSTVDCVGLHVARFSRIQGDSHDERANAWRDPLRSIHNDVVADASHDDVVADASHVASSRPKSDVGTTIP